MGKVEKRRYLPVGFKYSQKKREDNIDKYLINIVERKKSFNSV